MPVIAFEGLDGVGKTTMANAYAQSVQGGALASLPMAPVWKVNRQIVNSGNDVEARFNYFLQLNRVQLAMARQLGQDGLTITLESSIYRTVATHRVLGSVAAHEFIIDETVCPDATFLLELPEAERNKRLIARDGSLVHSSAWDVVLHERQAELREEFGNFGLPSLCAEEDVAQLTRYVGQAVQV